MDGVPFEVRNFRVPEACQILRISRGSFYKLVAADRLRILKIGTRTLVAGAEIARFQATPGMLDPPRYRPRKTRARRG